MTHRSLTHLSEGQYHILMQESTKDQVPYKSNEISNRRDLLNEAAELVDGDRNVQYGDPIEDFKRTADMWNAYLGTTDLKPHDVAALIAMVKLSRIRWSPTKRDHWADLAGYAACGWDCVKREDK